MKTFILRSTEKTSGSIVRAVGHVVDLYSVARPFLTVPVPNSRLVAPTVVNDVSVGDVRVLVLIPLPADNFGIVRDALGRLCAAFAQYYFVAG